MHCQEKYKQKLFVCIHKYIPFSDLVLFMYIYSEKKWFLKKKIKILTFKKLKKGSLNIIAK